MDGLGIVEATERLYRTIFTAAATFWVVTAAWGLAIAPFNGFRQSHTTSLIVGTVLLTAAIGAFWQRAKLFALLRRQTGWLVVSVLIGLAALWVDGGWRSSYYLASYAAIGFAAVTGGLRWSLGCGLLLAAGYVVGLALHGYGWDQLEALNDADSVVANTGGYLIAAYFVSAPIAWLGGFVSRINQIAGAASAGAASSRAPGSRLRTATLSVREVEVAQLVAAGLTNEQIAERLVISDRTVQSHVRNAMRKVAASNRTELAVLAEREGLVPPNAPATDDFGAAKAPDPARLRISAD